MTLTLFATTPKGLENLLLKELQSLGAENASEKLAGVTFSGTLEIAYKICLWSRLANRVLLLLNQASAKTPEELYGAVQTIQWDQHFDLHNTFAVHVISVQSAIDHTLFAAQKVKDAIVDQFREKTGDRPNVSKERPDISIFIYLHKDVAYLYLDLSGESLHKRGYRLGGGAAPLKENLAAAILERAKWQEIAKQDGALLDPMCGSGTLLIEAALMAGDIAPGMLRKYMGFHAWKQHRLNVWQALLTDAEMRKQIGLKHLPTIVGYDADSAVIKMAFENIERAGLTGCIHVEKRDLSVFTPMVKAKAGLVVSNPPYGERLGDVQQLKLLYATLGTRLKEAFIGWKAAIFTGNPDLGKQMGLRAKHSYAFFNGVIPCKLLLFDVEPIYFVDNRPEAENERRIRQAMRAMTEETKPLELMNRLRKNLRHLRKCAKKLGKTDYRIYDCDLPEYKFTIDIKADAAYVTEYTSPASVNPKKILLHRLQMLAILPEILDIPAALIFFEEGTKRH